MSQTKTRLFEVKQPILSEFFDAVDENELHCDLEEVEDHETLIVKITYEPEQRDQVMNLIELIDEFESENEEEDD